MDHRMFVDEIAKIVFFRHDCINPMFGNKCPYLRLDTFLDSHLLSKES